MIVAETAVDLTEEEFVSAIEQVRAGLLELALLDRRRMPKATDLAYQDLCSVGALLADRMGGSAELVSALDVASLRCHSCSTR